MKVFIWVIIIVVAIALLYMLWKKSRPLSSKINSLKCGQNGKTCTESDLKSAGFTTDEIEKAKDTSIVIQNIGLGTVGF